MKLSIYEGSSILKLFEVRLSESAVIGYSYFDLLCLHHLTWHYSCRTLLWWHHRMFAEWCSVTCHCLQIKPCHKSKQASFSQPTELDVNANRTVAWTILFTFFFKILPRAEATNRSSLPQVTVTVPDDAPPGTVLAIPIRGSVSAWWDLPFVDFQWHIGHDVFIYIYIYIPGSSRYVKFLPFGMFFGWKGTNFTHLEDPGIYIYIVSGKLGYITSRPWSCFFSHCLDHVLPTLLEVELKPWRSGA